MYYYGNICWVVLKKNLDQHQKFLGYTSLSNIVNFLKTFENKLLVYLRLQWRSEQKYFEKGIKFDTWIFKKLNNFSLIFRNWQLNLSAHNCYE